MTFKTRVASLLKPIHKKEPCGTNVRYKKIFDDIKKMRTVDDETLPTGVWQEANTTQLDRKQIITLCTEVLCTQSKDLQIICWLAESLCYEAGLQGLLEGVLVLKGCAEKFWDALYPRIEEGDTEERLHILAWFSKTMADALLRIEITQPEDPGLLMVSFERYLQVKRVLQKTKTGKTGKDDADILAYAEEMRKSAKATYVSFYDGLEQHIQTLKDQLDALQAFLIGPLKDDAQGIFYDIHQRLDGVLEASLSLKKGARAHKIGARLKEKALSLVKRPTQNKSQPTKAQGHGDAVAIAHRDEALTQEPLNVLLDSETTGADPELVLNRDNAYDVLEKLTTFLVKEDAQSPLPLLLEAVCNLRKKSFTDIMKSFDSTQEATAFFDQINKLSKK